jgi:hypothetical protein
MPRTRTVIRDRAEPLRAAIIAQMVRTTSERDRVATRHIIARMVEIGMPVPGDDDDQQHLVNFVMREAGFARVRTSRMILQYGDQHNKAWTSVQLVDIAQAQ